ncbi:MAG TPA: tetratricopeptide repeat protein [Gemmatimonadales bacterium]
MSDAFLSSEEFADEAHQLYNQGLYDDAIELLRRGVDVYPFAAELHVGIAYAQLAREQFAWARRSFERVLELDPEHEDALVGYGETLLKFGEHARAVECFETMLVLGYREDHDLVLQAGRALFREGAVEAARRFFTVAAESHPDSSEAAACRGYADHRLGDEAAAIRWLRHALELDESHVEARIYLGNLLYDRGEFEAALFHFARTEPDDHVDELAVWRLIELKKSIYHVSPKDVEIGPWAERLVQLASGADAIDVLLDEIEATQPDGTIRDPLQLELFSTLLMDLEGMHRTSTGSHRITTRGGLSYIGTWEEIVLQMQRDDPLWADLTTAGYMEHVARRSVAETGVMIPSNDAEAFVLGSAAAGLLSIVR